MLMRLNLSGKEEIQKIIERTEKAMKEIKECACILDTLKLEMTIGEEGKEVASE